MANSSSSDQSAFRAALDRARNCEDGNIDAATSQILETAIADLWRRIQDQPTTYTLTSDEFALFNYFIKRFGGNPIARDAVARYWDNIGRNGGKEFTKTNQQIGCVRPAVVDDFVLAESTPDPQARRL